MDSLINPDLISSTVLGLNLTPLSYFTIQANSPSPKQPMVWSSLIFISPGYLPSLKDFGICFLQKKYRIHLYGSLYSTIENKDAAHRRSVQLTKLYNQVL